jgi:hypothetical protein
MKYFVWGLVLLLVVLHQDLWNWDDDRLMFHFMPVTLAYHAAISVAASILWLAAIKYAWPENLAESSDAEDQTNDSGTPAS